MRWIATGASSRNSARAPVGSGRARMVGFAVTGDIRDNAYPDEGSGLLPGIRPSVHGRYAGSVHRKTVVNAVIGRARITRGEARCLACARRAPRPRLDRHPPCYGLLVGITRRILESAQSGLSRLTSLVIVDDEPLSHVEGAALQAELTVRKAGRERAPRPAQDNPLAKLATSDPAARAARAAAASERAARIHRERD